MVTYCHSGVRAGKAEEALKASGFTYVRNGGGYDLPPSNTAQLEQLCTPPTVPKVTIAPTRFEIWRQLRRSEHVTALSSTIGCSVGSFAVCAEPGRVEREFGSFCHAACKARGKCTGAVTGLLTRLNKAGWHRLLAPVKLH